MKSLLALFGLFALQFSLVAHAAPETYAATVEDGTAKVIGPVGTDAKKLPAPKAIKVVQKANAPASTAPNTATQDAQLDDLQADRHESVAQAEKAREATPTDTEDKRLDSAKVERNAQSKELRKETRFDIVPDAKVSEMATRLKYTNDILKRFGRAYDYRSTTLKEFKKILAELEKQTEASEIQN